jgi:hypothetical protein
VCATGEQSGFSFSDLFCGISIVHPIFLTRVKMPSAAARRRRAAISSDCIVASPLLPAIGASLQFLAPRPQKRRFESSSDSDSDNGLIGELSLAASPRSSALGAAIGQFIVEHQSPDNIPSATLERLLQRVTPLLLPGQMPVVVLPVLANSSTRDHGAASFYDALRCASCVAGPVFEVRARRNHRLDPPPRSVAALIRQHAKSIRVLRLGDATAQVVAAVSACARLEVLEFSGDSVGCCTLLRASTAPAAAGMMVPSLRFLHTLSGVVIGGFGVNDLTFRDLAAAVPCLRALNCLVDTGPTEGVEEVLSRLQSLVVDGDWPTTVFGGQPPRQAIQDPTGLHPFLQRVMGLPGNDHTAAGASATCVADIDDSVASGVKGVVGLSLESLDWRCYAPVPLQLFINTGLRHLAAQWQCMRPLVAAGSDFLRHATRVQLLTIGDAARISADDFARLLDAAPQLRHLTCVPATGLLQALATLSLSSVRHARLRVLSFAGTSLGGGPLVASLRAHCFPRLQRVEDSCYGAVTVHVVDG